MEVDRRGGNDDAFKKVCGAHGRRRHLPASGHSAFASTPSFTAQVTPAASRLGDLATAGRRKSARRPARAKVPDMRPGGGDTPRPHPEAATRQRDPARRHQEAGATGRGAQIRQGGKQIRHRAARCPTATGRKGDGPHPTTPRAGTGWPGKRRSGRGIDGFGPERRGSDLRWSASRPTTTGREKTTTG
jgi:hypothetical protein